MELGIKLDKNWSFLARQCSLVICGFIIRDSLPERIYRELRGPPVLMHDEVIFVFSMMFRVRINVFYTS